MPSLTTNSVPQFQERQPLRRATYVHVSDLISAYNINHVQLEREIARANSKRNKYRKNDIVAATRTTGSGFDTEKNNNKVTSGFSHDNTNNDSSDSNSDGVQSPDEDPDPEGPVVPQKRLQPPRGGFNLCVLVGKINLVVDKRRVDQSRVRLAEVEIGDETGTVSLRARDEQIDLLEKIRSKEKPRAVVLRNCTLELYQGKHIRLAVTKWGKLTEYPDNVASTPGPPPTMNIIRNFSFIDLSLVASEISDKNQPESLPYASAATSASTGRQSKKADVKTNRSTPSSTKTSSTPNKQGQYNTKHQQTSRRNNRSSTNEQRRQHRSYGGMKVDNSQASRSSQFMYHGIQAYHGYNDQSMDMHMRQQYPAHVAYTHSHIHSQTSRQQDVASAQFALQQQYEMQQRQLHQLYSREQNRQVGQVYPQQPPQMLVRHMSSFDASIGSYTGDVPMSSDVGNSQNLCPPQDHLSHSSKIENHPGLQEGHQTTATYATIGPMFPYRIGKMNPEASSFAPSYLSAAQGANSQQQMTSIPCPPQYSPYNISQQHQQRQPHPGASIYPTHQSQHLPPLHTSATISAGTYHHTLPHTSHNVSLEEGADEKTKSTAAASTTSRSHRQYNYVTVAPKDSSKSSGKENVTSKP